jgi:hypothetical protein
MQCVDVKRRRAVAMCGFEGRLDPCLGILIKITYSTAQRSS